jgi:hypothetical protein
MIMQCIQPRLLTTSFISQAGSGAYQSGTVWIGLSRLDDPNDDAEIAAVYRNFTVSAIEGAAEDRAPTYQPPPRRPARPGPAFSWL